MVYVLVIDHIGTGGAERILADFHRYLTLKGHRVFVFCLTGKPGTSPLEEGMCIRYGSTEDVDPLFQKAVQQVSLVMALQRYVNEVRPDVIFSFLEKSNLLTTLVRTSARKVLSVHNVLSIQYTKVKSRWVRKVLYALLRGMYAGRHRVIAVSKQVKDDLVQSIGVPEGKVQVVNNYVDQAELRAKAKEEIGDFDFRADTKYILNVGRFSLQKGQWKLLKAFACYTRQTTQRVHLLLMGEGSDAPKLQQLAAELGIADRVSFLPFQVNPYKYMAHAHLFVLSSLFEGFPIVLAEVSSLRIPFVGTRKSVPEELFDAAEVWQQCVVDGGSVEADFSPAIHPEEEALAELLRRGVEDAAFRQAILEHTSRWESQNDKCHQFEAYLL